MPLQNSEGPNVNNETLAKNPLPKAESAPTNRKEFKMYSTQVDGKEVSYPENYPDSFLIDGPLKAIAAGPGSATQSQDNEALGKAVDTYLAPTKEIFQDTTNLPIWYQKTLAPLLEKEGLSLEDLRPEDVNQLGLGFRGARDAVWDFPFPEEIKVAAARAMKGNEGNVPTLSALIQQLEKTNPEIVQQLFTILLQKGPDGLMMSAFLAKQIADNQEKDEPITYDAFEKVLDPKDYRLGKAGETYGFDLSNPGATAAAEKFFQLLQQNKKDVSQKPADQTLNPPSNELPS